MTYRQDIDGLRAISVLAVILYHLNIHWFKGGFLGVDVFFVISGYLITYIICQRYSEGTFSLSWFYIKRIRRILPALFFVTACCIPFAYLWLLPSEFDRFAKSLISVNLFVSNIYFGRFSDYFDSNTDDSILIHTWSLSVEEQFYLLFPLLFITVIGRFKRISSKIKFFAILSVVSLLSAEILSIYKPYLNFYLTTSRAWEFLIGGIGSLMKIEMNRSNYLVTGIKNEMAAFGGLLLILLSIFIIDANYRHPSLITIFPVFGAVLVLLFGDRSIVTRNILSIKPLVYLGLISYSAYLWHQPVIAFYRARSVTEIPLSSIPALFLLIIILSYISWRYIEQPFRKSNVYKSGNVYLAASSVCVLFVILGAIGLTGYTKNNRLPEQVILAESKLYSNNPRALECRNRQLADACIYGTNNSKSEMVVWGDSHADQLMTMFDSVGKEINFKVKEVVFPGCTPLLPNELNADKNNICIDNSLVLDSIVNSENIKVVVLHAYWQYHIDESTMPVFMNKKDYFMSEFGNILNPLVSAGKKVLLIGPIPRMPESAPTYLAKSLLFTNEIAIPEVQIEDHNRRTILSRSVLSEIANKYTAVEYLEPLSYYCTGVLCTSGMDFELFYRDESHLSNEGAMKIKAPVKTAISTFN